MKKLLILVVTALTLGACSSSLKTTNCTYEISSMSSSVELEHKGDKLQKQTSVTTFPIADLGVSESEIKTLLETEASIYEDVKGITFSFDIKEGVVTNTIVVDYAAADLQELVDLGLVEGVDGSTPKIISLKETMKSLEASGFSCTVK